MRWEPNDVLTAAQVGAWLQLTPKSVRRLDIPYLLVGKARRRYVARDVAAWIDARTQGGRLDG